MLVSNLQIKVRLYNREKGKVVDIICKNTTRLRVNNRKNLPEAIVVEFYELADEVEPLFER